MSAFRSRNFARQVSTASRTSAMRAGWRPSVRNRIVAGAEAQDAAPARQLVDRQHGTGRHARVTGHGIGHTWANADAVRVHGEQGRRGPGIGEYVLPVDDPHVLAPRGFGELGHLDVPGIRDVLHQEQIAFDHGATCSMVRTREEPPSDAWVWTGGTEGRRAFAAGPSAPRAPGVACVGVPPWTWSFACSCSDSS